MKSNLKLLSLIIIVIFTGLILVGCKEKKTGGEELMEKYTPGFKQAEELGLVAEPKIKREIKEANTTLTIEKVWYSSRQVYVFYSLEPYVPHTYLNFGYLEHPEKAQMKYHKCDGYPANFPERSDVPVIDGKYYGRITYNPLRDEKDQLLTKVQDVFLTNISLREKNKTYTVAPIKIPVKFDISKEKTDTFKLNKEVDLLGRKLYLHELKVGPAENIMKCTFKGKENEQFYSWDLKLTTDKGEERGITSIKSNIDYHGEGTGLVFAFAPFDELTREVELNISNIDMIGSEKVEFELNTDLYQQYLTREMGQGQEFNLKKLIGVSGNSQTYLEHVYADKRGIDVEIEHKNKENIEKPYEALYAASPLNDSCYHTDQKYRMANVVTLINDKEKQGALGNRGQGPGNRMSGFIEADYVKESQRIKVLIENLTFRIFGEWNIPIKLDK